MNELLRKLLDLMYNKHLIGNKHIPEKLLMVSKIKHLNKTEQNLFYEEYAYLIKKEFFFRLKKKTGKGSDWHISLNPEKIDEIKDYIKDDIGDDDESSIWTIL